MPPVNDYKCSLCDFTLPSGWCGYMYVENEIKQRIPCAHPGEERNVEKVLGVNYRQVFGAKNYLHSDYSKAKRWWSGRRKSDLKLIRERTGYNSFCVCLDCINIFVLDLGDEESEWRAMYSFNRPKDQRLCTKCNSTNIKTMFELIKQPCPKCRTGKIIEIVTGIIS